MIYKKYNTRQYDIEQVKNFVKDIINGVNDEKRKEFKDTYNLPFIKSHYDDIVKNILYNQETKLQPVDSFLFLTAMEKRKNMLITLAEQLNHAFLNFTYNKEDFAEQARNEAELIKAEVEKQEKEKKQNNRIVITEPNIKNKKEYLQVKNKYIFDPNTKEEQEQFNEEEQKKKYNT